MDSKETCFPTSTILPTLLELLLAELTAPDIHMITLVHIWYAGSSPHTQFLYNRTFKNQLKFTQHLQQTNVSDNQKREEEM